jgi:NitT/TauT family transport system substrate-binding protein
MRSPRNVTKSGARAAIVGLALTFALVACSSGTGSSSSAPAASAPTGSGAASAEPARAKLVVGISAPVLAFAPLYVAKEKGYWEEENLDVELTSFKSGTENQQALLGDAIDIGAGGYTEPINLTSQGAPTVIFASAEEGLPHKLVAAKGITDVNQLVGKTLGVSKVGSLSDQITRIALTKAGVDADKVKYQQAGDAPSRLAALEAGAIDGTILSSPSDELAVKAGFPMLIDVAKQLPGFAYELLYAKKATIEAKQDVFLRFMKGYIRGAQYTTDPANKDEVLAISAAATGQKAEDFELTYNEHIGEIPATGKPNLDGIQQALDGTKQFGGLEGADKLTGEDLYYPDLQQAAASALGLK